MSAPATDKKVEASVIGDRRYDVAVVGYGPAGVACAHLLGQRGLRVIVIERDTEVFPRQRALSVDDEALRVMRAMGHYDEVSRTMHKGATINFTGMNGKPFLTLLPLPTDACLESQANFIFQPHMEGVLRDGVSALSTVTVLAPSEFITLEQDDDEVRLTVKVGDDQQVIRASYAIGCDGGSSSVRKTLGIPFTGKSYDEKWIDVQAFVKRPFAENPHFSFFCLPDRPGIDTPCAAGMHRWEWRVNAGEVAEDLLKPESVQKLLEQRGVNLDDIEITRSWEYVFHVRRAAHWRLGRVFLAGDAAHIMPPFAGQGTSGAFRDASNLAWKIAAVLKGRAGEGLLNSYEDERGPHVETISGMAIRIGQVVMPPNKAAAWARDTLFRAISALPGMKVRLTKFMLTPIPLAAGGFLDRTGAPKKNPVGYLFPQYKVSAPDGRFVPIDEVLGDDFAIISMDVDPRITVPAPSQEAWASFAPRFLQVLSGSSKVAEGSIGDPVGQMWNWFRRFGIDTVIIRPDRYVYWAGKAADLPAPLSTGFPVVAAVAS